MSPARFAEQIDSCRLDPNQAKVNPEGRSDNFFVGFPHYCDADAPRDGNDMCLLVPSATAATAPLAASATLPVSVIAVEGLLPCEGRVG